MDMQERYGIELATNPSSYSRHEGSELIVLRAMRSKFLTLACLRALTLQFSVMAKVAELTNADAAAAEGDDGHSYSSNVRHVSDATKRFVQSKMDSGYCEVCMVSSKTDVVPLSCVV